VIAEEQPNVRKALRALFASEPDIVTVGEVNNGFDALDMIGSLHPDVLILGLNASNNLEIVQLVNNRFPNTTVVVPHKRENEDRTLEMMRAGVNIHVLKSASPARLVTVVREVNTTRKPASHAVSARVGGNKARRPEEPTLDPYDVLTQREIEVFRLVIGGLTNAMIAARLSISRRTVEIHRANMMRKLGLRNQYKQLLKYAIERDVFSDTRQEK